jgi:hypothetical protein
MLKISEGYHLHRNGEWKHPGDGCMKLPPSAVFTHRHTVIWPAKPWNVMNEIDLGSDKRPPRTLSSYQRMRNRNYPIHVVRIDDCDVGWISTIHKNNISYAHHFHCNERVISDNPQYTGHWSDVILVIHQRVNYGHWQHDQLVSLMAFPEDVMKSSYFITCDGHYFIIEMLEFFGFAGRIIIMTPDTYISVDRVWTIDPYPRFFFAPMLLQAYRRFVIGKLSLDQKLPTRYAFKNRPVRRRIMNMAAIFHIVCRRFRGYEWEMIRPSYLSLLDAAKEFNTFRFFLAAHGAGFVCFIYMQPRTVVCEVQTTIQTSYFMFMRRVLDRHHIFCRAGNVTDIDPQVICRMVRIGLEKLKHEPQLRLPVRKKSSWLF